MDLEHMLDGMIAEEGLSVALIVGRDGLLVEGRSKGSADLQAIGALATRTLGQLAELEQTLASGEVSRMRLRFARYELLVEPLTETDILVAGVAAGSDGEHLLEGVARFRKELARELEDL